MVFNDILFYIHQDIRFIQKMIYSTGDMMELGLGIYGETNTGRMTCYATMDGIVNRPIMVTRPPQAITNNSTEHNCTKLIFQSN